MKVALTAFALTAALAVTFGDDITDTIETAVARVNAQAPSQGIETMVAQDCAPASYGAAYGYVPATYYGAVQECAASSYAARGYGYQPQYYSAPRYNYTPQQAYSAPVYSGYSYYPVSTYQVPPAYAAPAYNGYSQGGGYRAGFNVGPIGVGWGSSYGAGGGYGYGASVPVRGVCIDGVCY
jgi:hypothetical protein